MCLWIRKTRPQAKLSNPPLPQAKLSNPPGHASFRDGLRVDVEYQTLKHIRLFHSIHLARPAERTSERSRHKSVTIQTVHPLVALHGESSNRILRFQQLRLPKDGTVDPLPVKQHSSQSNIPWQHAPGCLCAHARINKKIKLSGQIAVHHC